MNQKQHHIPGKEASEISTTFKEIKDECWSHHASEQFLKVLEEDTNPHRPHQSQPGSQGCAGGGGGGWRGGGWRETPKTQDFYFQAEL